MLTTSKSKSAHERLGFRPSAGGGHDARTSMSEEMEMLFHALPEESLLDDYENAILEDNVLGKTTESNRRKTLRYLKRMYSLDPQIAVFRCFRFFAYREPVEIHQLALLCVYARDQFLAEMAPFYLGLPLGGRLNREDVEAEIERLHPDQYSYKMKRSMAQNLSSSFTHAGYLRGRSEKERITATTGPAAAAYAITLSYLRGFRGPGLFESPFCELLDRPSAYIRSLAHHASLRGWVNYKSAGGVVDVSFPQLLTKQEIELSHGQD